MHNEVGLCATCRHMRKLELQRGSLFYLCQLAAEDPRLTKYPGLPVFACHGYQPVEPAEDSPP